MGENLKEIRWKQRYSNFVSALTLLNQAVDQGDSLSMLESEGMVQRFEYTFELSWKTMKDFLESKGSTVPFPRDVIKEAFNTGMIQDGEQWLEMLDGRNLLSHTYNQQIFSTVVSKIRTQYLLKLNELQRWLQTKI